jgi:hypothetical protein
MTHLEWIESRRGRAAANTAKAEHKAYMNRWGGQFPPQDKRRVLAPPPEYWGPDARYVNTL